MALYHINDQIIPFLISTSCPGYSTQTSQEPQQSYMQTQLIMLIFQIDVTVLETSSIYAK